MSIKIEIEATNAVEARLQMQMLMTGQVPGAARQGVNGSTEQLTGAHVKPELSAAVATAIEAEEKTAPKTRAKKTAAAAENPQSTAPSASATSAPAAASSDSSDEPEAAFTRADLTQTIKNLHAEKGDAILVQVKATLQKFGAAKQSEVKDEDIQTIVTQLKAL